MISGLCLIDKPTGMSSFYALKGVKRAAETRKVGHAGTLDPFASGLLITLSGKMTKLVSELMGLKKEYQAIVRFGSETDTLDPTGECVRQGPVPDERIAVKSAGAMRGEQMQIPPAYSAIKVDGQRMYALARKGEHVQPKARKIYVYELDVTSWEPPDLGLRIVCSKGTYIRSIARDIGVGAGTAASLLSLRRTSIGDFSVDDAVDPDTCDEDSFITGAQIFKRLGNYTCITVHHAFTDKVLNGEHIVGDWLQPSAEEDGNYALFDTGNQFLAVAKKQRERFIYSFVANRLD